MSEPSHHTATPATHSHLQQRKVFTGLTHRSARRRRQAAFSPSGGNRRYRATVDPGVNNPTTMATMAATTVILNTATATTATTTTATATTLNYRFRAGPRWHLAGTAPISGRAIVTRASAR